MNQALLYYSLVLDILYVAYFLTSITMPDPQTSDMRHMRSADVSASSWIRSDTVNDAAVPLTSARLSKLWMLCLNDLLDGDLCKKIISFIFTFSLLFSFSNIILSDALFFHVSQLQTQQVMTSQIRSHIEYLIQTLSDALFFHVSQLQTQQVMTFQIRSHIEYLIQTYCILVLIL